MNAHQIASYVSLWAVAIAAMITSFLSVLLYRITTGLQREAEEYQRGWDAALKSGADRLDKNLALGLSDYDAQRVMPDDPHHSGNRS